MRERFASFMAGRNGNDKLNSFLLVVGLILIIISSISSGGFKTFITLLLLIVLALTYFRMFSRNIYKRREENEKYLRIKRKVTGKLRIYKERWLQRKDYKFFSCPACKTVLRVPRGHGKIKLTCTKCGNSFIGKT